MRYVIPRAVPRAAPLAALLWAALQSPAAAEGSVEVVGADGGLEQNVRAHLRLLDQPCDAPARRVRQLFAAAEEDIEPALRALGYYHGRVEKELDLGGDCWQASFTVHAGEPVRVRSVDVAVKGDGADDPAFTAYLQELPLTRGDVVHHGRYESIKTRLRALALERGYFDARLERSRLRINRGARVADVSIHFDTGARFRFGELRLDEQPLDESFTRRLAAYEKDAPYTVEALVRMDRNLSNSGYYRNVAVRPLRKEAAEGRIPVEVAVTPEARHAWRAGIGFATDSGPRVSLGYENRYMNRRGHRFSSELRLSPVISTLSADYHIPGRDPHKQRYRLSGAFEHDDTESFTSDSVRLGAFDNRVIGPWNRNRFLRLLHEQSDIGDEDVTSTFLLPGIGWDRTEADNPLRTKRGYRLDLEVQGTHEALLSSTSLLQLRASGKGIRSVGESGRVVARADLGLTLTDEFEALPASLRFFAGGDNSVRGYAFESLGPENEDGEVVGGKHLITASLEYEHRLWDDDWWGAVFVDAGNAFNTDEIRIKQGYGAGLRWYSPVGRVRVDLAFPDDRSEDDWRIHFGFGVDL